ncbi:MAG: 2-amino-4-hydroxy-6-hydroxymethyldihydropteridine diphosphokinase [Candidatus Omnitrophica bacterium]|nr:2-amino-4-hydroxy-6-hydroxymethyldihydropteridine diphosphokinase [Candidatus Omnitrophota bacterium]
MNRMVIALGSNIEPDTNIQKAKEILIRKYHILAESCFKTTKSVGDVPQADFINGALLLETESERTSLKATLKTIEAQLGRGEKHSHEAPRTIDLDIVLWNETIVDQNFYERDYLKESVLELVPDLKY